MIKKIITVVILVLLIIAGIRLVKHKKAAITEIKPPLPRLMAVRTITAKKGSFSVHKTFLGQIVAKRRALLAARITSHILTVSGRPGTVVQKGDLLIQLDDRSQKDRVSAIRADLAAAETQLATQKSIFSRDRKLFKAQAISQEAFDQSRTSYESARARVISLEKSLNIAVTDLSYTVIKAPAAGVIARRMVDPGDLATPGKTLFEIEETGAGYYILVNIPQADFAGYKSGNPVQIIPDKFAGGGDAVVREKTDSTVIPATVSRIHPAVGRGTLATIEIDIDVPPFSLPTGAAVRVSLLEGSFKGWRVPARAVLENVDKSYLFSVTADNLVQVVPADILADNGDWLVVSAELNEKNRLIIAQESALLRLSEDQAVKVVQ